MKWLGTLRLARDLRRGVNVKRKAFVHSGTRLLEVHVKSPHNPDDLCAQIKRVVDESGIGRVRVIR